LSDIVKCPPKSSGHLLPANDGETRRFWDHRTDGVGRTLTLHLNLVERRSRTETVWQATKAVSARPPSHEVNAPLLPQGGPTGCGAFRKAIPWGRFEGHYFDRLGLRPKRERQMICVTRFWAESQISAGHSETSG